MESSASGRWVKELEEILAALLLSVVWLIPNHQLPWTAFHHELVIAIALGWVLVFLGWKARQNLQVPFSGVAVVLLALVPWLQYASGMLPKTGTAFVSSSYLFAFGVAIMTGFSFREVHAGRFTLILMLALVLAALANLPIQVYQWFQWYSVDLFSWSSVLVTPIGSEQRPSGFILQPNLLATLQVWALLGLSWLYVNRNLSFNVFLMAFSFVTIGLGLTQSRVGMLEMAFCAAVFCSFGRRWVGNGVCLIWVVMLATVLVWSLNFREVAEALDVQGAAEGRLSAIDGARIDAWRAFGMAILDSPWVGYGFNDVGYPYVLHADTHPHIYIGQRFAQSHTLLLGLALWGGLPLASVLVVTTTVWGVRLFGKSLHRPVMIIPLLMVITLSIHAMLELPHQYLFLLIPAGLFLGLLCSASEAPTVVSLGRGGAFVAAFGLWMVCGVVSWDYFPYQERYTEWRFDSAKIGKKVELPIKPPLVLTQLHDELELYRWDFSKPLTEEQLEWIDSTTRATTSGPAIFYTAVAHGMSGNRDEALRWMMRYNAIVSPSYVDHVRRNWSVYQASYPKLSGLDWPPYAGRLSTFRFEAEPLSAP